MKKVYLVLLAFIPMFANAQTITQSDLPSAGDAWLTATDTTYNGSVGSPGTGQTWNFNSDMQIDEIDTAGFVAASSTPFANLFPNSNLASGDIGSNTYGYYTTNSSGMFIDGVYSPGFSFIFSPAQLFIPVPFSFGDSRTNNTSYEITDGQTFRSSRTVFTTLTADGSGTLTLPGNQTFSSVLRIKSVSLNTDSTYLNFGAGFQFVSASITQTTAYRFLRSGGNINLLLSIEADSLGQNASSANFYVGSGPVSVPTLDSKSISAYPNPADQFITLSASDLNSFNFTIHDITGKQVSSGSTDAGAIRINTAVFPAGIYYYSVTSESKSISGKFVVKH